jgi:hypothetical protein
VQNVNYAELAFMLSVLGALLRIVWYGKEIVDTVKTIALAVQKHEEVVSTLEKTVSQHSTDIAVIKAYASHK